MSGCHSGDALRRHVLRLGPRPRLVQIEFTERGDVFRILTHRNRATLAETTLNHPRWHDFNFRGQPLFSWEQLAFIAPVKYQLLHRLARVPIWRLDRYQPVLAPCDH